MTTGADEAAAAARFGGELDNFRSAAARALEEDPTAELPLRLVGNGWRAWNLLGRLAEGRDWANRVLDRNTDASTQAFGRALVAAAYLAEEQSDHRQATLLAERAETILEMSGDERGLSDCWIVRGQAARCGGDLLTAEPLYLNAYGVARDVGDGFRAAKAADALGWIAHYRGDIGGAAERFGEALELARAVGDRRQVGLMLGNLGATLTSLGNPAEAVPHLTEALEIATELGDAQGVGAALQSLGECDKRQGRLRAAGERWLAALDIVREIGFTPGEAACLDSLAGAATAAGRHGEAVGLFAAAAAIRERDGSGDVAGGPVEDETRAAHAAVGTSAARLRAEGAAWTADEVRAAAVEVVAGLPGLLAGERPDAVLAAAKRVGLTAREVDIVDRLVERKTDQEIAAALFVSVRTVTTHVSAVLRKLEVASRRDVAARAAELGIVTT